MIAIIVPAHNEHATVARCIESLLVAASAVALQGEDVQIVVVMDACTDDTSSRVGRYPVHALSVAYRNVGSARAAGADFMLGKGARWLAFTDADSVVPPSWLADQLEFNTDAVCGTVKVDDWLAHPEPTRTRYASLYQAVEGHGHIHGANLGVSAQAYRKVGGFRPLAAHEDVQLVADLINAKSSITWTAVNCVTTSARLDCRCRDGFGDYLKSLSSSVAPAIVGS